MEPIKFDFQKGRFVASEDALKHINLLLRQTGDSGDQETHKAMASTIIGPVLQIAEYEEWTSIFFAEQPVGDGEIVRIAYHKPVSTALFTSLNGEPLFSRPSRRYGSIEYSSIDAGLEIGWDDMRNAGWNVLERCIMDTGSELARKRDAMGKAILDAAATASSHTSNSTGSAMSKDAVDLVFKSAAGLGWKIDRVAINSGTIMDMTNWVLPANSMWRDSVPSGMGEQVVLNGYVSNYGGASWYAKTSVPSDKIYFSASPQKTFAKKFTRGDRRQASDINIFKRTDYHVWDETLSYYILNPYPIWCVTITS